MTVGWGLYWAGLAGYVIVTPYAFWKGSYLARLGFSAYLAGLLLQYLAHLLLKLDHHVADSVISFCMCLMWLAAAMRWPRYWLCGALSLEAAQLFLYSSWLSDDGMIKGIFANASNILALLWLLNFATAVWYEQRSARRTPHPQPKPIAG
ncbi:MAG: hypothetical protein WA840_18515 [Caulobacteraceae bacterium]